LVLDLEPRLEVHRKGKKDYAFTKRSDDWVIHFSIRDLNYEVARKIEEHIKKMKSRKYIENLTLYPEINKKLIDKYSAGSSRSLSGPTSSTKP
jgi:putative endonuclease